MASRQPFNYPTYQAWADDETFLAGGTVEFFDAGTSNNRDIYQDAALTTTAPNPITLNSRGEPQASDGTAIDIYLDDQPYKIVLKNSAGVTKRTIDDYSNQIVGKDNTFTGSNTFEKVVNLDNGANVDPEHATDSGTDAYVSATNTSVPSDGVTITRDFQSANTTTTPTLDGKTITDRDGNALWAGAANGVHELQYASGTDTYLLLDPRPTEAAEAFSVPQRDAGGRTRVATPTESQDAANKGYVDGFNGAGVVPVSRSVASSDASVVFNNMDSTYEKWTIEIKDARIATDAETLMLRTIPSGGGSTGDSGASDYEYLSFKRDAAAPATVNTAGSTGASEMQMTPQGLGNAAGEFCQGEITIHNPAGGATSMISWELFYIDINGNINHCLGTGRRDEGAAIIGVEIFASSGNIAEGNFNEYGVVTPS